MNIQGLEDKLDKDSIDVNVNNMTGFFSTVGISYNLYTGTADPVKVAKRRAKNKVARKQRRRNRG